MQEGSYGAALLEWARTGAGPLVTADIDHEPGDLETFRRENERSGIVRIRVMIGALVALNVVGFATDPLLLDGMAGVLPTLREARQGMTLDGLFLLAISYLPLVSSRIGSVVFAWVCAAVLCGGIALVMGALGGPSTPWLHYVYPCLFVTLLAWAAPAHRLLLTVAMAGLIVGAWFGAYPEHLSDPLAGSTIVTLALLSVLVLAIGLRIDHVRLRLFLFRRAAERANDDLGDRVAQQTVRIQSLLDRVEQAREDERRELAAELHDEMGQVLTGMRLVLRAARSRAEASASPLSGVLAQLGDMMQQLSWTVRNLLVRLRPRVLDDLGFAAAAEWLAQRTDALPGVVCRFRSTGAEAALSAERATAAFRVLQEALTNAVRHADAGRITVELDHRDDTVELAVHDDGRGFDVDRGTAGLGIAGMYERARACGGRLTVRSSPDAGTRVALRLPAEPSSPSPTGSLP